MHQRNAARNSGQPAAMHAEVWLYDFCTLACGYCTLAETGFVRDTTHFNMYKDQEFVARFAEYFNSRTTAAAKWNIALSGGEPLVMPNLGQFCTLVNSRGNKVSFYTNLSLPAGHENFKFLLSKTPAEIEYIMASYHPQAERDEDGFFDKIKALKAAGHSVFFRFVGHPARLGLMDSLSKKCAELDVCFYPTTLFSTNYPGGYSSEERVALASRFSSISQVIQLNGGLDVSRRACHAGSRLIFIDMRTGEVRPCISVMKPVIGNIYKNTLNLRAAPATCTNESRICSCDVNFQQDIVIGVEDNETFHRQMSGFAPFIPLEEQARLIEEKRLEFKIADVGQGRVKDEGVLFFDNETVAARYSRNKRGPGLPRAIARRIKAALRRISQSE